MPDVAISRCNVCYLVANRCVIPGDSHGRKRPRNDSGTGARPTTKLNDHLLAHIENSRRWNAPAAAVF